MISPEIKEKVIRVVEEHNLSLTELSFPIRFRENFIYLDCCNLGRVTLFARLEYCEQSRNWSCAVFFEELNKYLNQPQVKSNPRKIEEVVKELLHPYLNNLIR